MLYILWKKSIIVRVFFVNFPWIFSLINLVSLQKSNGFSFQICVDLHAFLMLIQWVGCCFFFALPVQEQMELRANAVGIVRPLSLNPFIVVFFFHFACSWRICFGKCPHDTGNNNDDWQKLVLILWWTRNAFFSLVYVNNWSLWWPFALTNLNIPWKKRLSNITICALYFSVWFL